jgi:hypothetical protein
MAFNIFATATSDIPLANLDANFTMIGSSAVASTLYPTASTSITYGTAGTSHIFSGSIGAFTLSGTVAGGGNQLNNVVIGTTTPLAGAFTTLSATGITSITDVTEATSTTAASLKTAGGLGVAKKAFLGGAVNITDTTASTSKSTGALIIGANIGLNGSNTGRSYFGGPINISTDTYDVLNTSTNSSNGTALVLANTFTNGKAWHLNSNGKVGAGELTLFNATDTVTPMVVSATGTVQHLSTISIGNATPSASGAGITFPATQSASTDANTLDDYEEGTFTATLKGSTTDPTVAVTSTGVYTKVGRLVYVSISFVNVTTTGAVGDVTVSGLPFAAGSIRYTGSALSYNFDLNTGTSLSALVESGGTIVYFYSAKTSTAWQSLKHTGGLSMYLNTSFSYNI